MDGKKDGMRVGARGFLKDGERLREERRVLPTLQIVHRDVPHSGLEGRPEIR